MLQLNEKSAIFPDGVQKKNCYTYLSDCAKKAQSMHFTIPFDRQELADYLCVERSAMSAELGKLKKTGHTGLPEEWILVKRNVTGRHYDFRGSILYWKQNKLEDCRMKERKDKKMQHILESLFLDTALPFRVRLFNILRSWEYWSVWWMVFFSYMNSGNPVLLFTNGVTAVLSFHFYIMHIKAEIISSVIS